ncbi:MAG: Na+/H+ antiporter NhaC family protein [Ruminococcaceae bacterium]|nr:Na+/H+ antiporter NhaC family protein [Oscillospiraceae bacterium]
MFEATIWSLLPPVIAIALALITKEVFSSLFIGILAGGLMFANFNPVKTIDAVVNEGVIAAVSDTAGIFVFLVVLGVMVALINKSGGSAAFGRWAETHVKTKVGAALATFALGILIFIDDYFNCLTVGSVMRPVTDAHKISRVKLAYLIDATAAPICMIAPISSWAAAVSEYVADGQGLTYFIKAIPYNFYSLLTLVFIITITVIGFDFGKMSEYEIKAQQGDIVGDTSNLSKSEKLEVNEKGIVFDLIFPIIVLIITCVTALLYVGGFFPGGDYTWDLIGAFGNTDATVGLPMGSLVALVVTIIYLLLRRVVTFKKAMEAIPQGFIAMVPAILILTLATALKNMTGLLDASSYVKGILANAGALEYFLPVIVFLVACFLAFSTGTSWGTFGILIPIVSEAIGLDSELGVIAMSACLAGSVFGDHCSPISDTTIMSSAGAECNHIAHVSTQIPYASTVAAVSAVSYIIAGFVRNALIVLPIAIVLMFATIFTLKVVTAKKAK